MAELPFTVAEFLAAVEPTFELEANRRRKRSVPRASALASCARQQYYYLHDFEWTNQPQPDQPLTAEQGRMFEDITIAVMETMGYVVASRQTCIGHPRCDEHHEQGPLEFYVTGHPDGHRLYGPNLDRDVVWGFEHKHFGIWQYDEILKKGLPDHVLAQVTQYGEALGWDKCLVVITSQDASAIRSRMTINKNSKNQANIWVTDDMNPKVQLFVVDLRTAESAHLRRLLRSRAVMVESVVAAEVLPAPEYNPFPTKAGKIEFPCSHCEWRDRCIADGPVGTKVLRLPWVKETQWT